MLTGKCKICGASIRFNVLNFHLRDLKDICNSCINWILKIQEEYKKK
jgi:hypothetical protein